MDLSDPPANVPEGFRFVDVQRLAKFVEHSVICNKCQRGIIQSQLSSFVSELKKSRSFSTAGEIDQILQNYTLPCATLPKARLKLKREEVTGFSSTLIFGCSNGHEIEFETSKSVITGKKDRGRTPEINLRLSLAFLNLGKGATHLYRMAAHLNMNIPTTYLDGKSFARCEKSLGPYIEACARNTCKDALAAAIVVEQSKEGVTPATTYNGKELTHVPVSVDMGWVKRSSGHRYDSDSGCATAIEQNSGKIVSFEIKAKFCKACELQKEKQESVTGAD